MENANPASPAAPDPERPMPYGLPVPKQRGEPPKPAPMPAGRPPTPPNPTTPGPDVERLISARTRDLDPERGTSGGAGAVLTLLAGALIVSGSLLPWITAVDPSVGIITKTGVDQGGDGVILLPLGLILLAFGIVRLVTVVSVTTQRLMSIPVVLCVIITWLDRKDVASRVADITAQGTTAYFGPGLAVIFIGTVLAIIGTSLVTRPEIH